MGTSGLTDSCYMWRRDGALGKAIQKEIDDGALRPRRRERESAGGNG
jgi:hypothetical protein